jgi:hypothetical protein
MADLPGDSAGPQHETVAASEPTPTETKDTKIFVGNLPRYAQANAVRRFVAERLKLAPDAVACKKAPKWSHAVVSCRTDTPVDELLARLDGCVWKKQTLTAQLDAPAARGPRPRAEERCLNDQVTPLWR